MIPVMLPRSVRVNGVFISIRVRIFSYETNLYFVLVCLLLTWCNVVQIVVGVGVSVPTCSHFGHKSPRGAIHVLCFSR